MSGKAKYKTALVCMLSVMAACALVLLPNQCADGAYRGIISSLETVVPSLFPFTVLTIFLCSSGLFIKIFSIPATVLSKIFKIDKEYCALFFLGIIGGYPSCAKTAAIMKKDGRISKSDAETLICFCTNAGPAFMISAVGAKMLFSPGAGAILYASSVLSSLTLMAIYRGKLTHGINIKKSDSSGYGTLFLKAVSDGCRTLTLVCAFIVLFSVLLSALPDFGDGLFHIKSIIYGLFEVTAGCSCFCVDLSLGSLIEISAVCGFSGICVIFQIAAICGEAGISIKRFVFSRILCAIFQAVYTFALLIVFPVDSRQVFASTASSAAPFVLSPPFPALMLLLCCVAFPICLSYKKTK